jgi:hypothetical protein
MKQLNLLVPVGLLAVYTPRALRPELFGACQVRPVGRERYATAP